jgi:TonB family protein
MKQQERPLWPWVLLLVAAAGGFLLYSRYGEALSGAPAAADLAAQAPGEGMPAADTVVPDTVSAGPDSVAPDPRAAAIASPAAREVRPAGTGALRMRGVPRGSIVQIDQQVPTGAVSVLSAGRHEIAISAPLHHFFVDTVFVRADDTLDYVPTLVPVRSASGQAEPAARPGLSGREARDTGPCEPGAAYDASQCFDERPRPATVPFIPVPEGSLEPERGTLVWVQVSADGRTAAVRSRRSSGSREFDQAAVAFVQQLSWSPALKLGTAVAAWVPLEVRPARQ